MYEGKEKQKMSYALWRLVNSTNKNKNFIVSSKQYEITRTIHVKNISGKNNPFYGKKHSIETKIKMSKNHADISGKNNPLYGIGHSEKSKNKMSKSKKGSNHPFYGKHHTKETKEKILKSRGIKPVVQYDLNNNFIFEYNSAAHASKITHIRHDDILNCCKGKKESYKGYIWKYK